METVVTPTTGRIVGIGASAGGLESLELLFAAIPADTGFAFVVVQHLSPDFRSLMDELIGRHSVMPVIIATDGMAVQADHIYLMPPGKEMIIRDRRLVLTDKEAHTFSLPIDTFFRSLAQDVGEQAIAVVLSGSGSDGSRGVVEVKRAGGLVLAESPTTAKFDGMPLSAASTGVVEHVLAPGDLARVLCGLPPLELAQDSEPLSDDPAMDAVLRLLRDLFGIDFSLYKTTTVARRVQRRLDLMQIKSLHDYVEQLHTNTDELDALYQDLLIGVTQFFRDPEAFELLEREIIPKLLDRVPPDEELRVWIAGCGTGEEAYSLAMLFWEQLSVRDRAVNVKILATDVHQASLDVAGAGIYGDEQLQYVTPQRLQRFFTRRVSGYQVSQDLRQLIVFARHNVTKDAPFTRMHFISCRNMLIYLQPHAQRTVLSLFHFGLVSGGVLFLGPSETPGALSDEFVALDEHWKMYRKRRDVQLLSQVRLPLHRTQPRRPVIVDLPRVQTADPLVIATYDQLLDRYMPPGFLLDEDRVLLDSFAGAERMLKVRRRRPSASLIEMLDDDLRTVVNGAVQRALKERASIAYSGVKITFDGLERRCTLKAEPLVHPRTGARHVLVTFHDLVDDRHDVEPVPTPIPIAEASRQRLDTLESELAYTRETLQATIEELETSNEEMQATNEELVASNEELQSTNEELHSVNEELYTVNAEYQQKITELRELNTDMQHLIEGTDVGTVFLDRELHIRRFTSRIASIFRLQPHDVGRQLTDFSHNIQRTTLIDDILAVHNSGKVIEDEVRDRNGTRFFLRILPYRVGNGQGTPTDQAIDGVVLTLTDISALTKARERLAQLSAIVESSDDAIVAHRLDGTITAWNRGAERLYGYTAEEAIGRNVGMLTAPGGGGELAGFAARLERGEHVEHARSLHVHKDGNRIDVSVTISPIYDANGTLTGVSAIARDMSPLLAAQREIEEGARRREQFLAMLSHELRNPLAAVMNATAVLQTAADGEARTRAQAVIARQTAHMQRLLDDLLDVSRITRGKFELRTGSLDLRKPLEAAIESTAPLYAERGVRLEHRIPDVAMPVRGDANRLMQVVVNLLSNAANYSPRLTTVRLDVTVDAGRATICVTDHGVGIEPALQDRIFELFVQAEQRLDRSRGGLGVGLSLARSIVELHGGTIAVHSEGSGKGSTFTVTVPIGEKPRLITDRLSARVVVPRRIVLVDDQDDSREMLRMLLEARDHVVLDAADGPSAIALIERERPDIAFIDIGLPTMTGYEVAQHIRKRADLAGVRLVALTGYGNPSDVALAREAGFDEHVIKPAELARLEQILAGTN
jgi:two-component system, chemotaxis family, CheB/CheR fusion protein